MIIHATRKFAARLPKASKESMQEGSALGNWHADRLTLDRRQSVLFCHDETRAVLFIAGLRKPQFAALGGETFRQLFADTLAALNCPKTQIRRALLSLGPCEFDTETDRSVLGSMRVARQGLEAYLWDFPNVLMMDPVEASRRLTRRPVSVRGKHFWPQDRLRDLVAGLE